MCCQSLWMTRRYILECLLTLSAHSFCSAGFTDEDTENGGEKVREEKVRVEKDGGKSNWYLSLITGVPITFFIFAIPAGVIIYKRLKKCMKSPEKPLNSRSESLLLSSWMTVGPAVAQKWKHLCKTTRDPCCINLVFVHLWWFKMQFNHDNKYLHRLLSGIRFSCQVRKGSSVGKLSLWVVTCKLYRLLRTLLSIWRSSLLLPLQPVSLPPSLTSVQFCQKG